MEKPLNIVNSFFEKVEDYSATTYELSKLKMLETSTSIVVSLLFRMIVGSMLFLFFAFLNIGIALLLGDCLGKIYYGFFIVASFYLITMVVFYFLLHNTIKEYLSNLIITKSLNNQ